MKRTALIAAVLVQAWASPGQACEDGRGCYRDGDGRWRDPALEYARRHDERDPGHLLTLGEEALILGIGTVWYWADRERNLGDWDYPSWKQRFSLEAWRFDNNHFPINFLAHPLNGAAFYALPRANDHGIVVSSLYAFATSFAWEFLIEFREKVSINDLLVTYGAGVPLGEFASKLWYYFNGTPHDPDVGHQVAAAGIGFPHWAHRRIAGASATVDGPYDELGLSTRVGRYLETGYQARFHRHGLGEVTTHGLWLGGRLSTIPGEGRPGSFTLFFHDADVVSLSVLAAIGRRARELELTTDTHLLGLYHQAIDRHGCGHAAVLGLSLAYRYRFQDFERYNDRLGILHLPAPGVDYAFSHGAIELHTSWRLSGDFAGLHAPAYSSWARAAVGPGDRPKSILRKHGYAYGWGISSRLVAELRLPVLDVRAAAFWGAYDSQEHLDRTQEELTLDPDSTDRFLELDTSLGFTVPSTTVRLGAGWISRQRWSRVESASLRRSLNTWTASVGAGF